MKCPHCDSKIKEASLINSENKFLNETSIKRINDFLPEKYPKKVKQYCDSCIFFDDYEPKLCYINERFKEYYENCKEKVESNELDKEISSLSNHIAKTELIYSNSFQGSVKIYSTSPNNFLQEKFIESQIILDTGMWSTSSDNLDAMWSVIHDNIAREGSGTENKLQDGFNEAKKNLRQSATLARCNTIVDFKHTFSELAGNGKILIYSSGMASIDKSRALPDLSITNENRKILDELIKRNNELKIYLDSISPLKFKDLIQSI